VSRGIGAAALVAVVVVLVAVPVAAQIDPEPRLNLQMGVEGPLKGNGILSGYAFVLWNRPHFLDRDLYLRTVFAPTFLISELVFDRWPAEGHAIGVGLAGGFFPYNFEEFRNGRHEEEESFWGHGGEAALTYYRRILLGGVLPLEGQLRLRPQYVAYERNKTDARFRVPPDTAIYTGRVGLRLGGIPPELHPDLALEASVWYEPSYRVNAGTYGFPEQPQELAHFTQKAWARTGGIFTLFRHHTVQGFFTAGTAEDSDALTSFRLGSALPFRSEFPLILHGYYIEEVFARRFWLLNLAYRFPVLPDSERIQLQLSFDYARVDYASGHELPRHGLRGVGIDLSLVLTRQIRFMMGWGYGFDAPRNDSFGGQEAHALMEIKF
jgi:hypothetical protein